jgi:hypothetical protein
LRADRYALGRLKVQAQRLLSTSAEPQDRHSVTELSKQAERAISERTSASITRFSTAVAIRRSQLELQTRRDQLDGQIADLERSIANAESALATIKQLRKRQQREVLALSRRLSRLSSGLRRITS